MQISAFTGYFKRKQFMMSQKTTRVFFKAVLFQSLEQRFLITREQSYALQPRFWADRGSKHFPKKL